MSNNPTRNRTHTFIASGDTDTTAVIAGMLLALGTTSQSAAKASRGGGRGNDCLRFDDRGDNDVTIAWRKRDCWMVSFRHSDDDPDTAEYRSVWDAAEAVARGAENPADDR